MAKYRSDDINLLLPTWREKVRELMVRMGELGFKPVLFDGLRTAEEALKNAAKGTGIANSMHLYGCAADLICDVHGWSCHAAGCNFYRVLGAEAEAMGMVWGHRIKPGDYPHVQGVAKAKQNAMRAFGVGPEHAGERDAMVRAHFAGKS